MVELSEIQHLTRPSRVLFTVYLVRAIGAALGLIVAIGFIAFRFVDWAQIQEGFKKAEAEGIPIVALVGAIFLVCYAVAAFGFYVRYRTLRYRFDEDGITRQWGLLFRRESFLAYARIQDVQVTQGVVERLFGIGTIAIQTASGSKGSEESIEGLPEFPKVREFLYDRMKGKKSSAAPSATSQAAALALEVRLANEVRDAVRELRLAVEGR